MIATLNLKQDKDKWILLMDSISAKELAKELLYMAEKAEDHKLFQAATVLSIDYAVKGEKINSVYVRPSKQSLEEN